MMGTGQEDSYLVFGAEVRLEQGEWVCNEWTRLNGGGREVGVKRRMKPIEWEFPQETRGPSVFYDVSESIQTIHNYKNYEKRLLR
jgi:hypothetical protein